MKKNKCIYCGREICDSVGECTLCNDKNEYAKREMTKIMYNVFTKNSEDEE